MELLELIPALLDSMKSPNGQAYVFIILYGSMGFYIYKMTSKVNNLKTTLKEIRSHTDSQFESVSLELKQINKVLYKMAGKLEIESNNKSTFS